MALMATTTALVSIEEYLSTVYEPEVDYVDGELEDRNVGGWDHSGLQARVMQLLFRIRRFYVRPELHIRVSATRIRIPDIAVYMSNPQEQIPTTAPFLVIEILSAEDRMDLVMRKLNDYSKMGCANIWLLNPRDKTAYRFDGKALTQVTDELSCAGCELTVSVAEIFSEDHP
jgi:Uma2 family endonuclease